MGLLKKKLSDEAFKARKEIKAMKRLTLHCISSSLLVPSFGCEQRGKRARCGGGFALLLPFAQISMGASDLIVKAILSKTLATCDVRKALTKW